MGSLPVGWLDFVESTATSMVIIISYHDVRELVSELVNQGFDTAALRNLFITFCKKRIAIWGNMG